MRNTRKKRDTWVISNHLRMNNISQENHSMPPITHLFTIETRSHQDFITTFSLLLSGHGITQVI
jgi:hypothetical protein